MGKLGDMLARRREKKTAKEIREAALSKLDLALDRRVQTFAEREGITGPGLERELAGESAPKKVGGGLAHEDGG